MAQFELLLPKMGESVAEATIIKWLKMPGDQLDEDDVVLEVATDKVDSEVPSPVKGKLIKRLVEENDVVQVGDVLAIIETGVDAIVLDTLNEPPFLSEPSPVKTESRIEQAASSASEAYTNKQPFYQAVVREPQEEAEVRFYSPIVKTIAAEEGLSFRELDQVKGTGAEGRVTKQDVLDYVAGKKGESHKPEVLSRQPEVDFIVRESKVEQRVYVVPPAPREAAIPLASARNGSDEIIEMDRMRKIIAEHMVSSKQISPHVTSFVEADVTNMVKWRDKVKNSFEKREGEKITFTPIFIEAVARAIKDMPMINVSVEGTQIIKKRDINIGIAAALPSGNLIVPVIRNADQLNLVGITKTVNDLANRAKNNKLLPDEIKDGTFTITNVGSFGNITGTPIINQPQVAILAVGMIKKKPAVIETPDGDLIGIRHLMILSLSYDHRVVDGALGGTFLKRVADYLEEWDLEREI